MTMENLMKVLMDAANAQGQAAPQQQESDPLSQVLGGLVGGQQATAQRSGAGGMLGEVLGGLIGAQQTATPQPANNSGDMLLGALEQIIGGRPGTGQVLSQTASYNMGMNEPIMLLLQPVVNQVAAKAGISPQIATVVASVALHYLLSSHPSTSPKAPLDLGSVMQQLASGNLSQGVMQNSGMVKDVMQATGLNQQQATQSLNATFETLGGHVHGKANLGRSAT